MSIFKKRRPKRATKNVKKWVLAWDPDFTKLTPEERESMEEAEKADLSRRRRSTGTTSENTRSENGKASLGTGCHAHPGGIFCVKTNLRRTLSRAISPPPLS